MATHFIMVYIVDFVNAATREKGRDYCESGVREMKYLKMLEKSVASDAVALFKIKPKVL